MATKFAFMPRVIIIINTGNMLWKDTIEARDTQSTQSEHEFVLTSLNIINTICVSFPSRAELDVCGHSF